MTDSAEQGGETPARRRSRTGLLLALLPVAAFVVIGVFLFRGLSLDPSEIYSVLINKPAPAFELAPLPGKDWSMSLPPGAWPAGSSIRC